MIKNVLILSIVFIQEIADIPVMNARKVFILIILIVHASQNLKSLKIVKLLYMMEQNAQYAGMIII